MLEVKNLTVKFKDSIILEDVSLEVEEGEVISIIGPSGSGKSTLIRSMNGLVKPGELVVFFKGRNN